MPGLTAMGVLEKYEWFFIQDYQGGKRIAYGYYPNRESMPEIEGFDSLILKMISFQRYLWMKKL